MAMQVAECFSKVAELAIALGVEGINKLPGCWEHHVDDHWLIKVNGHTEPVGDIKPYEMMVWFNDWPAGIIHPITGGVIAAGTLANEDTFIAALDAAILAAGDAGLEINEERREVADDHLQRGSLFGPSHR